MQACTATQGAIEVPQTTSLPHGTPGRSSTEEERKHDEMAAKIFRKEGGQITRPSFPTHPKHHTG